MTGRRRVVSGGEVTAGQHERRPPRCRPASGSPAGTILRHAYRFVERQGTVVANVPSNGGHLPHGSIHRMTPSTGHWFRLHRPRDSRGSPYGSTPLDGTYAKRARRAPSGALAGLIRWNSGGTQKVALPAHTSPCMGGTGAEHVVTLRVGGDAAKLEGTAGSAGHARTPEDLVAVLREAHLPGLAGDVRVDLELDLDAAVLGRELQLPVARAGAVAATDHVRRIGMGSGGADDGECKDRRDRQPQ